MSFRDETTISRRAALGGAVAGLATTAVPGVASAQTGQTPPQAVKQDPTTQYPKPPFPAQEQPAPGLASKMTPRPDHGETSYKGSGRLTGRKALVTGGDSGIGRAAAIAYAREGADVAIVYLPAEEPDAKEVVDLIRKAGRKAVPIPGDLTDPAFCKRLVETAVKELGGLDILVNNAGTQRVQDSIEDVSDDQLEHTFRVNVYAPFRIIRAALPHLSPGATIINTSSVNAYEPSQNLLDYAMTKACLANLTKGLAKGLAAKGIRVNAVAPGPYWTPLQVSCGKPPEEVTKIGADTPMGRIGQPAELAATYVLLASQESSYATGQVYGASGGGGFP